MVSKQLQRSSSEGEHIKTMLILNHPRSFVKGYYPHSFNQVGAYLGNKAESTILALPEFLLCFFRELRSKSHLFCQSRCSEEPHKWRAIPITQEGHSVELQRQSDANGSKLKTCCW